MEDVIAAPEDIIPPPAAEPARAPSQGLGFDIARWHAVSRLLTLATLSTLLLLSDDFLQQLYTPNNRAELETSFVSAMFVTSICLLASGSRLFCGLVLGLFASMQLPQIAHISFIGEPLTAMDISRIGSEWHEISLTISAVAGDHWPALLAWGVPYALLGWMYWHVLPLTKTRWAVIAMVVVVVALCRKPYRAMTFDLTHFMPGPTRSSLHNSINTFGYYITRMSFGREVVVYPEYPPYEAKPIVTAMPRPDRIWVVLGESIRGDRMGVYGYKRDTTPHLSKLKDEGRLIAIPGQAASTATGTTIPLLLNGVAEPGNVGELYRMTGNLFRLAKNSGYETFWLSAQESKLMSKLGPVDRYATREDAPLQYTLEGDQALLDQLVDLDPAAGAVGIIHTRSAHIPYDSAYAHDKDFQREWPDGPTLPLDQRQANQYDNALRYFDELMADILQLADQQPGNTLVVITSDHGQMLGEEGRWGHNVLTPQVASVPMLFYQTQGKPLAPEDNHLTHHELHSWLAERLGWKITKPGVEPGVSWFHGNNIYGDNLFVRITENEEGIHWEQPQLVSHLQRETR